MIIQSGYGVLAYNTPSKIALPQQASGVTNLSLAVTEKNADQVTLSNAGKALAASERTPTQTRTPAQEHLLKAASSDRESAEKMAYQMATAPSTIFYDISGQLGVGDGTGEFVRKLSTTGEIVGDDYINKFYETATAIDAQRQAIYDSETKKGTDPVEILSKMIDFTNKQSQDYLNATGWGWRGTSAPT